MLSRYFEKLSAWNWFKVLDFEFRYMFDLDVLKLDSRHSFIIVTFLFFDIIESGVLIDWISLFLLSNPSKQSSDIFLSRTLIYISIWIFIAYFSYLLFIIWFFIRLLYLRIINIVLNNKKLWIFKFQGDFSRINKC